jgi:hypothetical protein
MTTVNNISLQNFSSLFNAGSSGSISDGYKESLYLARVAREDKSTGTQNYAESTAGTMKDKEQVSRIADEVTISQSAKTAEDTTTQTAASSPVIKTKPGGNNSNTNDNTINQLKAKKNSLQQELNRLNQKGGGPAISPNQEGEEGAARTEDATGSTKNRMTGEESPLTNLLKSRINEIEQEIAKQRNQSDNPAGGINQAEGPDLPQLRQKKIRIEQQLRNLDNTTVKSEPQVQNTTRPTPGEPVEEAQNSDYQEQMEKLKMKQEIRNLQGEINVLERQAIISKTQAALDEMESVSSEAGSAGTQINIEI